MKAQKKPKRGGKVVHKLDESPKGVEARGEKSFINQMKAQKKPNRGGKVVHKLDERPKGAEARGKSRS